MIISFINKLIKLIERVVKISEPEFSDRIIYKLNQPKQLKQPNPTKNHSPIYLTKKKNNTTFALLF